MSAVVEHGGWSSRRVWIFTAVVLMTQLGLIYWLSDRRPPPVRVPGSAPTIQLAGKTSQELMALQNPTFFALPRRESFAGLAWMAPWTPLTRDVEWNEAPAWLPLDTVRLGGMFNQFVPTNVVRLWHTPSLPEPALLTPVVEADPRLPQRSTFQVVSEGLEARVSGIPELPSWPPRPISPTDFEVLTNSVISAMYGPDGKVISASLLSASGSSAADDYALNVTRRAHFEVPPASPVSTNHPASQLKWARLIFEWNTLPGTNAPSVPKG